MSKVAYFDDYRPCAVFDLGKQVHVVPIDTIRSWAEDADFSDDEDVMPVVRRIISEWLKSKGES